MLKRMASCHSFENRLDKNEKVGVCIRHFALTTWWTGW